MLLREIVAVTQGDVISPDIDLDGEVRSGFASDLMSDVLRYDVAQGLLITGLTNPQIIRTAEVADVAVVLLVRGKELPPDTANLANQIGIPVLGSMLTMYEACGRLYGAGLPACRRYSESG